MGLKRFDGKLPGEKKNFKQVVIVLCICLIAVLSFTSYALYQVQDQKDIANSKVGEFKTSDVYLAIMIDGVKSDTFPAKDSGKGFDKLECTNGEKAEWDYDKWELNILSITGPTECTISFVDGDNAAAKLKWLAKTNTTEMFTDDTVDQNIRYMGADPANYVDLGNGNDASGNPILWRVIGVMNNIDDGTENKETRLKVIREEQIGYLNWDDKGQNNWNTASLNKILNDSFYNRTGDYSSIGITESMKPLIEDAVYHLGGPDNDLTTEETAIDYYAIERSGNVFSGNPKTWTGKVGLMYPSDYGYATSGGSTKDKAACAAKALYYWEASINADCKNYDWLFDKNYDQWLINPIADNGVNAVFMHKGMAFTGLNTNEEFEEEDGFYGGTIRPVLYLKSEVKIMSGDGTKTNPYKLGI